MKFRASEKYEQLVTEEQKLQFSRFTRADALKLGLGLLERAKGFSDPIALEIVVNGLIVFRFFADGAIADSDLWLERKRNTVELMSMSSLRFLYWLEAYGTTIEERKLDPNDFAAGGGGFPIVLKGTGMIGSICVSGLPEHLKDHELVTASIREFLIR